MKKIFSLMLALAMLMGLMAGCGTDAGSAESAAASAASSVEETAGEPEVQEEAPAEEPAQAEAEASDEEEAEAAAEPEGPFEAASAELPVAEGEELTYFCELPGYMSMFNVNSYDDINAFKFAEQLLGVDVKFTIVNSESFDTNFQLMVASGDITDLVGGASDQYTSSAQMFEDGVAIDLMEYQDSLPNFFNALEYYDEYRTLAITQDGTMPEVICIADDYKVQSGMQIRKDWLDQLGMDIPETIDELHEALLGFVSECGADHALLLTGSTQLTGTGIVGGFGTIGYGGDTVNMYVVDGEVRNGFLDDAYKDYMEMMAQWYSEGIIAQDFATESNDPFTSNADRYISGGNAGVWSSMSDNMDSNMLTGQDLNPDYQIAPMAQPMLNAGDIFHFGDSRVGASAMGKSIAISDCCEDVELACAFVDFFFTKEGINLANYGLIDNDTYEFDNTEDAIANIAEETDLERLTDGTFPMISFGMTYYTLACVATLQDFDRQFGTYTELNLAAMDLWTETSDDLYTLPTQVELNTEESDAFNELWGDISTYADTEVFKFVMGDYDFEDDWDSFIAQLEDMGIQECVDLYQQAYDRYIEAYGL